MTDKQRRGRSLFFNVPCVCKTVILGFLRIFRIQFKKSVFLQNTVARALNEGKKSSCTNFFLSKKSFRTTSVNGNSDPRYRTSKAVPKPLKLASPHPFSVDTGCAPSGVPLTPSGAGTHTCWRSSRRRLRSPQGWQIWGPSEIPKRCHPLSRKKKSRRHVTTDSLTNNIPGV